MFKYERVVLPYAQSSLPVRDRLEGVKATTLLKFEQYYLTITKVPKHKRSRESHFRRSDLLVTTAYELPSYSECTELRLWGAKKAYQKLNAFGLVWLMGKPFAGIEC